MSNKQATIYLCIDSKTLNITFNEKTNSEQIVINVCKQWGIGPLARHLFALRVYNTKIWLPLNAELTDLRYEFRIRYKVASLQRLKKTDIKAYDYYFQQARYDVRNYLVGDIIYDNVKRELLGLGVADMYRVMIEKDLSIDAVLNDYKKFISKEVIKHHKFFIKKPVRDSLTEIRKSGHDAWFVKGEYLKQLELMAPEYLSEEYKALMDRDGAPCRVILKISPYNKDFPGIRVCYDSQKKEWESVSAIEDLCFISISTDGTVQISRKTGIPTYFKFETLQLMQSFVSLLDGYYRLMVKWTFNLCKEMATPTLRRLHQLKCHGPVGGEFSYAKLEEKRQNRRGCYVLRESEVKYNVYFIDVCTKNGAKPKTYRLEKIGDEEYIFNDDVTRYRSILELREAYNKSDSLIYLNECLPPSEYDKSPLLLCLPDAMFSEALTDSDAVTSLSSLPVVIHPSNLQVYKDVNNTQLNCKLSHRGIEYRGNISHSQSQKICQNWETSPIKYIQTTRIIASSIKSWRNYCRNPNSDQLGPWCFTDNHTNETCAVPLCKYAKCRLTGPGVEYSGDKSVGKSSRKCIKWNTKKRLEVFKGNIRYMSETFNAAFFPDGDLTKSENFCRNPDADNGGPWCFVSLEEQKSQTFLRQFVEKEYCDIPFCNDKTCLTFVANEKRYTHFTQLQKSTEFKFGVQIWNSDDFYVSQMKICLSVLAIPLESSEVSDLQVGIEITVNFTMATLSENSLDNSREWYQLKDILKSSKFQFFILSWNSSFVTLHQVTKMNKSEIIFERQFKNSNNLLSGKEFLFYSFSGNNVLFTYSICEDDSTCEIHVTNTLNFERYWLLTDSLIGLELNFYLRAFHSAYISLTSTPGNISTSVQLAIQLKENITQLLYFDVGMPKTVVKQENHTNIINFWSWTTFKIELFHDELKLLKKTVTEEVIFHVNHKYLRNVKWFSIGSHNTVAHWALECTPEMEFLKLEPPECALDDREIDYNGTQWVAEDGRPCLLWISSEGKGSFQSFGGKMASKNYCRNPTNDVDGAFCYVSTPEAKTSVSKLSCNLRRCSVFECRTAGKYDYCQSTGNDFMGKINKTRSNRTCQHWIRNSSHPIAKQYLDNVLYADKTVADAKNYCRNPSRSAGGVWCYTLDENVVRDLCSVPDCDRAENTILLFKEKTSCML